MVTESRKPSAVKKRGKQKAREESLASTSRRLKVDADTDPWARGVLGRGTGFMPPRKKFLLVCEGEKTEPLYFESFKRICRNPIALEVLKGKGTPLSVVETAIQYKTEEFDEVWAIFDRDSFDKDKLHTAFDKARDAGINIAFTNEAFELWFILHYKYIDTGMSRSAYQEELLPLIRKRYEKNDDAMFGILRPRLCQAMQYASRLGKGISLWSHEAIDKNPFTGVHHLVYALLEKEEGEEMEKILSKYQE
ncbi:MAG: RloB family protein [Desulfovibrionaceae bacterium]|nr:RloB family protein [Desulfovibrionaceae bacterium]